MNDFENRWLAERTRRHFFRDCGVGLGSIAINSMMGQLQAGQLPVIDPANPMGSRKPPLPAKAKNVIFLHMAGAPSQLELFEDKPKLREYHGKAPPKSLMEGKRFAFLKGNETLLGNQREFGRYGECGMSLSELFPHHRKIVDEVVWLRGMTTDVFNHGPAKLFMNTGFQAPGRPSMGSWITYGLGSESENLPGFVVLQSGPRGPRAGNSLWASGFLPTSFQGVPFRGKGDAILHLRSPKGITRERERSFYDTVGALNHERLKETGDPEILTRLNAYEMAYPHADQRSRAHGSQKRKQNHPRQLRRQTWRIIFRFQLPPRPPSRRTWFPLRATLSHQLGQPRWTRREPQ